MEESKEVETQPEEDYVEGCHKENYMKLHICPIPTGGWCKDYVKCRNLEEKWVEKLIEM